MSSDDEIDIKAYQKVPENRVYIGRGPAAIRNHLLEKYREYQVSSHESRDVDTIYVGDPPVATLAPIPHSNRMSVTISCNKGPTRVASEKIDEANSRTFSDPKALLLYLDEILGPVEEESAPIQKRSREALNMLRVGLLFGLTTEE